MRHVWVGLVTTGALFLSACGKQEPERTAPAPLLQDARFAAMENVMRGARIYQEQCSQCHGPDAQGHPDWQNPKVVAAPPLNGTGNEWRRSRAELANVIKNGAVRDGTPVMPAWKGRLSDQEVEDVITWFQALWPTEVYDQWRKANASPAAPRS